VRQTFKWFRDHDVELPANPIQGTGLVWKIPSQSLIRDILCNPFYAVPRRKLWVVQGMLVGSAAPDGTAIVPWPCGSP
jgi:hypothetical protein